MRLSERFYERLPDRLRWYLMSYVRYDVFGVPVIIPRPGGDGLRPSALAAWKRHAIASLLPLTDGAFVDVGVNLGQTLVELRSTGLARAYVGFEPNPHCVAYVETLIDANGYRNCTIVPVGLGSDSAVHVLYRNAAAGNRMDAAATMLADLRPERRSVATTISVHALDDIRSVLPVDRIGMVKIDVEGVESQTIAGMTRMLASDRPLVMCEVLGADPAADIDVWTERARRLTTTLRSVDYLTARLVKSSDGARVDAITPIRDFVAEVWTPERAECFDYVFVPRERAADVLRVFRCEDDGTAPAAWDDKSADTVADSAPSGA